MGRCFPHKRPLYHNLSKKKKTPELSGVSSLEAARNASQSKPMIRTKVPVCQAVETDRPNWSARGQSHNGLLVSVYLDSKIYSSTESADLSSGTNTRATYPSFERASGLCICSLCDKPYRKHPYSLTHLDYQNNPWLIVLCDGSLVKI